MTISAPCATLRTRKSRASDEKSNHPLIIRFAPIDIDQQQYASVHAENENISLGKLPLAVDFYKERIRGYIGRSAPRFVFEQS